MPIFVDPVKQTSGQGDRGSWEFPNPEIFTDASYVLLVDEFAEIVKELSGE